MHRYFPFCFSSSNHNKLAETRWLKQHIFPMVLKAKKPRVKVPADPVSGEGMLPGLQMAIFSLYPQMVKNRERKFLCLFL